MKGIDISNLQGPPEVYRSQRWYQEAEFVIAQSIRPPYPYRGWDVGGFTETQLRTAREDGKKIGVYVWLWDSLTDIAQDIRARLDLIPTDLTLDMRVWLDVEDTTAASVAKRRADVIAALDVIDQWSAERGLPAGGVYTGQWYIDGSSYLNGWFPAERKLWLANYSIPPATNADRVCHQYTSNPIDTDVMEDSEIITVSLPVSIPCDQEWTDKKTSVVNVIGYVSGDLCTQLLKARSLTTTRDIAMTISTTLRNVL